MRSERPDEPDPAVPADDGLIILGDPAVEPIGVDASGDRRNLLERLVDALLD
jgi:hypothetical protein